MTESAMGEGLIRVSSGKISICDAVRFVLLDDAEGKDQFRGRLLAEQNVRVEVV